MLVHKMIYHRYNDAIFLFSISSPKPLEFLAEWNKKSSDLGIVYTYRDADFHNISTIHEMERKIKNRFDEMFEKIGIPIKEFDEVYTGFDWWHIFSAYLKMKNKKYTIFDIGGSVLKSERLYDISRHPNSELAYWETQKKYRTLSADTKGVIGVIWDEQMEIPGKKNIILDYAQLINELTANEKIKISSAFKGEDVDLDGIYTIIPMRSISSIRFSKIKQFDYLLPESQRFLYSYRLLVDYCRGPSEKIILKAHPNYDLSNYISESFPRVDVLPGHYPFEFINILDNLKISKVVNLGSSSTRYIKASEADIEIAGAYFSHFSEMNVVNAALHLSKYIYDKQPNIRCDIQGWKRELTPFLVYLSKRINIITSNESIVSDSVRIISDSQVDSMKVSEYSDASCTIIVNPSLKTVKLLCNNIALIKIKKISRTTDSINYVGDLDPEYLALVSNNSEIISRAKRYKSEKDMPCCNIMLKRLYIAVEDFIIDNLSLSGSILFRTASLGNITSMRQVWKLLDETRKSTVSGSSELFNHILDTYSNAIFNMVNLGHGDAMGYLGRMYRDGIGVDKNLQIAIEYMRKATDMNVEWAKNDLLSILWCNGTPEAYEEVVKVAKLHSGRGDGQSLRYLGLAYRGGKGVDKDLYKAAELLRRADEKLGWVKNELFDTLWLINTPETNEEMINVAIDFAKSGNGNAMGRLGRAYKEGRGVYKDLNKAIEYMREATQYNESWKGELINLLQKRGLQKDLREVSALSQNIKI